MTGDALNAIRQAGDQSTRRPARLLVTVGWWRTASYTY